MPQRVYPDTADNSDHENRAGRSCRARLQSSEKTARLVVRRKLLRWKFKRPIHVCDNCANRRSRRIIPVPIEWLISRRSFAPCEKRYGTRGSVNYRFLKAQSGNWSTWMLGYTTTLFRQRTGRYLSRSCYDRQPDIAARPKNKPGGSSPRRPRSSASVLGLPLELSPHTHRMGRARGILQKGPHERHSSSHHPSR